jgi:primosomal protein N' (replication factor Y)
MADYYSVSLAMILSMIIPRQLHNKSSLHVIANVGREEYLQTYHNTEIPVREFLELLWSEKELSLAEIRKYLNKTQLEELLDREIVSLTGIYKSTRTTKNDSIYTFDVMKFQEEIILIKKRAPRQAEALALLTAHPDISCLEFDRMIPRSITSALIKKGLVNIERMKPKLLTPEFTLNEEQEDAIKRIAEGLDTFQYSEYLLFGITGSGKTEVYIQSAQVAIDQGRSVIVLVPEIALTRQLVEIFSRRIPDIAVLHSAMSVGDRYEEWKRIKHGAVNLVLGPRSAVFAPLSNLGLIIMDEEQENSYKQEETPRYHVRDIARQRAMLSSSVFLLGSATPALETFYRVAAHKTELLKLSQRTAGAAMPEVVIEDMRNSFKSGNQGLISDYLRKRLERSLLMGQQSILFINRRGHSPMTICRECGNIASCPNCSVGMTFHRDLGQNVCHYCNNHSFQSSVCQVCGSKHLQLAGAGTQKVEEEIRQIFPEARIARLDLDSSRTKGAQKEILQAMKEGRIDILIGTQMVAKGLDFPLVSLVGVVDADSLLNIPDFRARERCFQLLVQVAGRAGRAEIPGEVVIQTYNPQEPLFQKVIHHDYQSFYNDEIKIRKLLEYPPVTDILRIVVSGETESVCQKYSSEMAKFIEEMIDAKEDNIMILGPAPCPISKIKRRYRYQIMIKCYSSLLLRSIAAKINNRNHPASIKLELDINPVATI